jgi:large subunit ribosomal protein L23
MSEKEIYGTIVRPLLTERSTILKEKFNQYVFETATSATKPDIKRAIEELFKVQVEGVRTMIVRGKFRRFGRGGGMRSDWKKAIVTLKQGQKIDFAEQAS